MLRQFPVSGRFCPAPFVVVPIARSPRPVSYRRPAREPAQGNRKGSLDRQDPVRTIAPSLISSTFTERRLTLSYNVCFGMPKSIAVA